MPEKNPKPVGGKTAKDLSQFIESLRTLKAQTLGASAADKVETPPESSEKPKLFQGKLGDTKYAALRSPQKLGKPDEPSGNVSKIQLSDDEKAKLKKFRGQ